MVGTVSVYEVEDFDRWKRAWDENVPVHRDSGVRGHQLHFHPTDVKRFVVVREFDDLDQARNYLASPARQQRMQAAGVVQCEDYLPDAAPLSR
jgi:antibiotic biosynthesis monooxygenase (ABM) superfamily enzyme